MTGPAPDPVHGRAARACRLAVDIVRRDLGLSADDILAAGRGGRQAAFARHVVAYLCHVALGLSMTAVAVTIGRDRTTIAYACRRIEDYRETPDADAWLSRLEGRLHRRLVSSGLASTRKGL